MFRGFWLNFVQQAWRRKSSNTTQPKLKLKLKQLHSFQVAYIQRLLTYKRTLQVMSCLFSRVVLLDESQEMINRETGNSEQATGFNQC